MTSKTAALNIATALFGAVALAAIAAPSQARAADLRSATASLAGQNSCANEAGTRSCAGQSKVDYDGGEWRAIGAGHCADLGGQLKPFQGVNPNKKS